MADASGDSGATSNPNSSPPDSSTAMTGADFLPSDTLTNRFKNFYRMATGSMSESGQKAYWSDADARYSALDCGRCEKQRDYLLKYSPIVRYMSDNIRRLGGDINASNIRCRTCTTGMLGGFDHRYGIMLCANYVEKQSMMEDVLAHEMVHAYDHLRFNTNLDHETDLKHVACSEIRASNLSGECRWANEFFRNKIMAFTMHQQDCVRRRAVHSVAKRPNCLDEDTAKKVVDEVWTSCFQDTRPFDEVFR
jgi:mitochondrial inner membrane protease ATP23